MGPAQRALKLDATHCDLVTRVIDCYPVLSSVFSRQGCNCQTIQLNNLYDSYPVKSFDVLINSLIDGR